MRVQSHIWISAFIRREMTQGIVATVLRKGSPEAGAIFIVQNHLNGTVSAYAPAPQADFMEEDRVTDRRFEKRLETVPETELRTWLDRQVDFDPDCWIVETERREGEPV